MTSRNEWPFSRKPAETSGPGAWRMPPAFQALENRPQSVTPAKPKKPLTIPVLRPVLPALSAAVERPQTEVHPPAIRGSRNDSEDRSRAQPSVSPAQPVRVLSESFKKELSRPTPQSGRGQASTPRRSKQLRNLGWTLVAVLGMLVAAFGCSLAEGDSDPPAADGKPASRNTNRLSRETSPYLLAHAHNPVDWYPWGPEALEKARKEDKPIFLSIGYSSCHWCHVMEKKVFSDPVIAKYMNDHFVNIKVDREERPDLDDIYMTALQMYFEAVKSPQTGGWPLSIFLTPDGRPLGGGTYFPPDDGEGRVGFPSLMKRVVQAWNDSRKEMEKNADILAGAVRSAARPRTNLQPTVLDRTPIEPVLKSLAASYDGEHGGFGFNPKAPERPKFPQPTKLTLLQYEATRHANDEAGKMLYFTLDRMADGGIYDHIGGGFHRYSTDRYWRVPHFEKMLYDNAQLADVYADAYRYTKQRHYRDVVEGTIDFVLRELRDGGGAFYSALDADSEGAEGKYYVWKKDELAKILPEDELAVCRAVYTTVGDPQFELGHVLERRQSLDAVAKRLRMPAVQLERRLADLNKKLLAVRQQRPAPARDEKILAAWNGLMIRTLARAGVILEKPEYVQAAEKAAEFVLAEMRDEKGKLYHSYAGRQAKLDAYLDDYAYVNEGLLALHLATNNDKWANAAKRLSDLQLQLFWDEQGKGCYFTSHHHEVLLARTKNAYDSVLPSGNSVTVRNLLRLASISRQSDYRNRARQTLELFVPLIADSPGGLTNMALALDEFLDVGEPATGDRSSPQRTLGIAPDSEILLAAGEQVGPAPTKKQSKPEYVTGQAFLSVDRLPAGGKCKVAVQLQIANGWHIHANPAGDSELDIATELEVESKLEIELKTVRYPAGKQADRGEGEKPQLLYHGKVMLIGEIEVPAAAAGKRDDLVLLVSYQACNDNRCLPPRKLKLTVPVTVARQGEAVKTVNEAVFAPPKKAK
ncbi:MAG: DUF255 domain-containing protein [Deltaproteobacteria bacterium]